MVYQIALHNDIFCVATRTVDLAMLIACLTIFVGLASLQALFVVKLADVLTDSADPRGTHATAPDVRRTRIA
ncbi:hypothetical protein [uncultured Methylobacterium sp.]|uniref:hypothetical protein n=1 Tax=uncultured Methylobacterium sp. TaxID=157278 RepID=UPI0035CB34FF